MKDHNWIGVLALFVLAWCSVGVVRAAVTVSDPVWTLTYGTTTVPATSYADCNAQGLMLPEPTRQRTWKCVATRVTRKVTTPVPEPVDCVVSAWSAWSACANGSQTRTRTVVTQPANGGAACPALSESQACTIVPDPPPLPPTGSTWTDLSSAPACAKVTIYPAKTVTDVAGAGIPIHEGRCLEATPATFTAAFWSGVKPGDVVTLRTGTYTAKFGEGTWYGAMGETYKKGTAAQPIAVVAAPGEAVTFKASSRPPLVFGNGDRASEFGAYLTFAGIDYIGSQSCISGGGHTTNPAGGPDETGGRYIRIVGGSCTITDANSNTMTGLIDLQSDGWKILGVTFRDPANRVVINNNHVIYIQGGADDVEVAYNSFIGLHTGHVVQIHQDGTPKLHERVSVHDNVFQGINYGDMRGISVVNIADASTIDISRNIFRHQGQGGWGCINLYRGQITVTGNDCQDSQGGLNLNGGYGGTRKVTADSNTICPVSGYVRIGIEGGASSSQITETNRKACP